VVNASVRALACSLAQHDTARRKQSLFCVDCGEQLRVPGPRA
jgi:hypothetical protein